MKYLLDVNVLLASIWNDHPQHAKAFAWLSGKSILICPIGELGFLFKDKEGPVEVVVANPANMNFKDERNRLHPASIRGKFSAMLQKLAPKMFCIRSSSEDDGIPDADKVWDPVRRDITPRSSFHEFIEREMD